jgi:hypothetical protein
MLNAVGVHSLAEKEAVMSENKTVPTKLNVDEFLSKVEDTRKREDSYTVLEMMQEVTGLEPVMWGTAIVGFGSQHYEYATGREGDMPIIGFSPRKQNLTLYLSYDYEKYGELLKALGKHSTGKSCLYIKKLADVDVPTLKRLIETTYKDNVEDSKS